ncbi:hypothetical protein TH53_06810 [Pedobacter lusitanus]|uniref:Methyltransferase domain-containing protein n=1 Tax=Pedobacter lusitanus TaxID=1503925 RepID=A0A0D0F884_9SPHI|nr:class I SAM-dependent methyltransferase [Pedobacter lusitanus]KIO77843.1 hypothetical protein TH53_06810 [Pedobacter lusitanus]
MNANLDSPVQKENNTGKVIVGFNDKPFDIFLLKLDNLHLVGRKTPARINIADEKSRRKSCLVEPDMLFGKLIKFAELTEGYEIIYQKLPDEVIQDKFALISPLDELIYPLKRLIDGQEVAQPEEYWNNCATDVSLLDDDEIFLREMTGNILMEYLVPGSIVYDPACSTGAFLAHLKKISPEICTVGQDLNPNMIAIAKERVDKVCAGNSLIPVCSEKSVDVVICRHLNLDVVTSEVAKELFLAAAESLKIGGVMVVIGHTPILITSAWMEEQGFNVLRRNCVTPYAHAVFQLYLFIKKS